MILRHLFSMVLFTLLLELSFSKPKTKLNVRRSTKSLTKDEWDQLRTAIRLMKMRNVKNRFDPLGFYFQANIHGWDKYDGTPKANEIVDKMNWHRCQHGHYFFLIWHRMYLYHFEKILQKVTGNSSLTVPYWDYFDEEERAIPEPFRLPPDPQKNPLYVKERCTALNAGMPLREEIVDPIPALSTAFFTVNAQISPFHFCHTFAGARIDAPKGIADRQGLLERIPHDMIHMFVGGPGGFLSDECKAARDPLFWFHHSTIDRIWDTWSALGGPELIDTKKQNQTFDFFNPKGEKKSYRVEDFLDSRKLNYKYDSLMKPHVQHRRNITRIPEVKVTAKQIENDNLEVGPTHLSIGLDLEENTTALFREMAEKPDDFEKLRFSLQVSFNYMDSQLIYDMHMNLPAKSHPFENKPYFFGTLVFFSAKCVPLVQREVKHIKKCFEVTENIKTIIRKHYIYSGEYLTSVNITFVPKSCDDVVTAPALKKFQDKTFIRFDDIHLLHYFID